jgi:hypothetical protein
MAVDGIIEKSMKAHTLKTSPAKLAAAVILGAASLAFISCYYVPGLSGGKARAGLVLPRAIAANTTSIALVVGGPGMDTMYTSYTTIPPSISIDVPSGLARTFTLLLNSPSATLQGVATVDLQPGESREIMVTPTVGATQIVIPDFQNSRIVQISDMNGTGWTAKTVVDFGGITIFAPYAVDFDNQGRIYIANNTPSSTDPGVIRIDDIKHTSTFAVVDTTYATGIKALAVDRTNGLIYYTTGSTTLYKKNINNIAAGATTTTLSAGVVSIAVDDQGMLYTAIPGVFSTAFIPGYVVKYNPATAGVVATSTYSFDSPWGIMVKGPYVYVSDNNVGGTGKAQIVRLDKNLQFVDSFPGPSTDLSYGPETFVATLNRKFTVIDEKSNFFDRLVSFDDMSGAGWTTFGSYGSATSGPGHFDFYSVC